MEIIGCRYHVHYPLCVKYVQMLRNSNNIQHPPELVAVLDRISQIGTPHATSSQEPSVLLQVSTGIVTSHTLRLLMTFIALYSLDRMNHIRFLAMLNDVNLRSRL